MRKRFRRWLARTACRIMGHDWISYPSWFGVEFGDPPVEAWMCLRCEKDIGTNGPPW